jgi:hypothetical protein
VTDAVAAAERAQAAETGSRGGAASTRLAPDEKPLLFRNPRNSTNLSS